MMDSTAAFNDLECPMCQKRFKQKSSLSRHKRKCSQPESLNFRRKSCKICSLAKVRCDLQRPTCSRCLLRRTPCQYVTDLPAGPIIYANHETTSSFQRLNDVTGPISAHEKEHQAARVAESIMADANQLAPLAAEYVDSVETTVSSDATLQGSHEVEHESSIVTPGMGIAEDQWELQLTPITMTPPLVKHSTEFLFRVLRTWPGMMASEIQLPPIIHISQLSNRALPLPLAKCVTIAKMWDGQSPGAADLVQKTVMNEMTSLFESYQSYDELNLLAALQALVIYIIILLFPTRDQTSLPTMDQLIFQNIQQVVYHVARTGLVMQEERDHVRPSWQAWIHVTSKRRAALALYLMHWSYSVLKGLPSLECKELGFMPAPAPRTLWQVSRREEWKALYDRWLTRWAYCGYLQREFFAIEPGVMIDRRTQRWLEEADEFGMMIMSLVNASNREPELFTGFSVNI